LRAPGTEIVTHVRVNFAGELAAIARVFVTVGRRRFAVLHASDSSGKAFLNQFSAALNTHGLPIVAAVPYERDTKDFTPMAKAVGASGADVVVVGGVTGPGIAFIRAMRGSSIERRSRVCRQLMIALFGPNWEIRREVSHSQALFQALRTRCYLSFATTKPRWR
jgi:ABC-type branched-subunit amino acid transport system substrate-binding protein